MDPRFNPYPGLMPDTRLMQLQKTDRNPSEEAEYKRLLQEAGFGGGTAGGAGGAYPEFSFDWTAAEKEALEKLTPYYNEKITEAGGDVERAKRLIEEDYSRGKRYREEEYKTQIEEETRTATEETRNLMGELNRRGVLFGEIPAYSEETKAPTSEYAQTWGLDPLAKRQQARKLAIQRVLARGEEVGALEKTRGIEEQNIAFPRYKRALEEEKKEKAVLQMAPLKYQQEVGKYQIQRDKYLQGRQI